MRERSSSELEHEQNAQGQPAPGPQTHGPAWYKTTSVDQHRSTSPVLSSSLSNKSFLLSKVIENVLHSNFTGKKRLQELTSFQLFLLITIYVGHCSDWLD